jgi:hypothetical protein
MVRAVFESTYTKLVVGGIIAFGAVVGGVYVGYAMLVTKSGVGEAIPTSVPPSDAIALRFAAGDAFPLEEYSDPRGTKGSFEELLRDKETILILGSTTCDNCLDLLKYAHETMPSRVKAGVQIVVVLRKDWWPPIGEYTGLLDNLTVALVDGDYWQRTYHWEFWPIIVGIDNSGIIQHMQYGYVRAIDRELVEYFYSTKQ